MPINISNSKNRDAVVAMEGVSTKRDVRYTDPEGRMVMTRKLLKTDVEHDLPAVMKKRKKPSAVANALVKGDPEIDMEEFGRFLADTSRVYVSKKGIVHLIEEFEVIHNPDGTVRDRRARHKEPQNINSEFPLRWTGQVHQKRRGDQPLRIYEQETACSREWADVRFFVRHGKSAAEERFSPSAPRR